jgi:holo-[acyl-carrier protein] synthase
VILGLGIDLVAIPRVERMLSRWGDAIVRRVLTEAERAMLPSSGRAAEYVAGRIAAKEAASKALGVPDMIHWHCAEVVPARPDPPRLVFHGVAADRARALGVERVLLTITHDAGVAAAVVVLDGGTG